MAGNGRKNADTLALALAAGDTAVEAATKVGMSERTVYRRLADPAFRRNVQALRGEMLGRALGRMANGMSEAADVLRSLLAAKSETVRLGAARSLMEIGAKLRESVELEARLQALEERASGAAGGTS
jgi:HEAT repeat protein